jgi:hypothetical protein
MTVFPQLRTAAIMCAAVAVTPAAALAQAWVPAHGEGAIAIAFQSINVQRHLSDTLAVDAGDIDTVVLLGDVTYGLTDKVAVDLAVPIVTSKYQGPLPHPGTSVDDGTYRSTVTDFRMSVRYNVTRKGVVFTPYIGTVVPSHSYAFYGHAAPGERLRELHVGAYAARLIASGPLAGLFVSGRAGYGFVEKVGDISHNRTTGDVEAGYFVTPSFRAFGMLNGQYTHGGIDFPRTGGMRALPLQYQPVHDIIQRVHYLHAGAGVSYAISDSVDMFASASRLIAGRNGHALNRGITVGVSWGFKGSGGRTGTSAGNGAPSAEYARMTGRREGSLGRCICQKSAS